MKNYTRLKEPRFIVTTVTKKVFYDGIGHYVVIHHRSGWAASSHKMVEHRHVGSTLLLIDPGSCLLHRLGNQLGKSRADCMRIRTICERRNRHEKELHLPYQEPESHRRRLNHHRKEVGNPHQEPHLPFHPGTQLLLRAGSDLRLRLGSHRVHRIPRPPVRIPIQPSKKNSTTRMPRERRGQTPRPRVWISHTLPMETYFMFRMRQTGYSKPSTRYLDVIHSSEQCIATAPAYVIIGTSAPGEFGDSTTGITGQYHLEPPAHHLESLDQHHLGSPEHHTASLDQDHLASSEHRHLRPP